MTCLRTTRLFVHTLAIAMLMASRAAAENIEIKLTCQKKALPQSQEYEKGLAPVFKTVAPAGKFTLPDFKNRTPLFAMIRLGDAERLMILDRSPENDAEMDNILSGFVDKLPENASFFNRLYFDANGNGNLTDDPVISAKPVPVSWGDGYSVSFDSIEASVPVKGVSLADYFQLQLSTRIKCSASTSTADLVKALQSHFMPACYYEGKGEIDGKEYSVAVVDANCSGNFYDNPRDLLFLTDTSDYGPDGLRCLDVVVIGKKTYSVVFDTSASKLILSPPSQPLCKVKLPGDIHRLRLSIADKPENGVVMFSPGEEIAIPAGKYILSFMTMLRKDKDHNEWVLTANAKTALPEVTPDKKAVFSFGEPFAVTATVSSDKKNQVQMSSARMIGAGGEEVTKITCLDKKQVGLPFSKRQPTGRIAPSYRILNSKGDIVSKGKFEFG